MAPALLPRLPRCRRWPETFYRAANDLGGPSWIVEITSAHEDILNSGSEWSFWRIWYQDFLDGKPLDWELQRRVALIPDADWDQGPAHIAVKIEEIRAKFDAEKAAVAVEEHLSASAAEVACGVTGRVGDEAGWRPASG